MHGHLLSYIQTVQIFAANGGDVIRRLCHCLSKEALAYKDNTSHANLMRSLSYLLPVNNTS